MAETASSIDWTALGTAIAGLVAGAAAWAKSHLSRRKGRRAMEAKVEALEKRVGELSRNVDSLCSAVQSGMKNLARSVSERRS